MSDPSPARRGKRTQLTPDQAATLVRTDFAPEREAPRPKPVWRKIFRRGPWENAAVVVIAVGVFMLMQPFSLWLYGYSFRFILLGTLGFVIVSHFPEE